MTSLPSSPPTRVLIVDDDVTLLRSLVRLLRRRRPDWEILSAQDGSHALSVLDEGPVDVVVTDLDMPQLDGFQLLEQLNTHHPQVRRVVHSAHTADDRYRRVHELSEAILSKPGDTQQMLTTLDGLVAADSRAQLG